MGKDYKRKIEMFLREKMEIEKDPNYIFDVTISTYAPMIKIENGFNQDEKILQTNHNRIINYLNSNNIKIINNFKSTFTEIKINRSQIEELLKTQLDSISELESLSYFDINVIRKHDPERAAFFDLFENWKNFCDGHF